jgi:beta-lactamase class A
MKLKLNKYLTLIAFFISLMGTYVTASAAQATTPSPIQEKLAALEVSSGGRLGVTAINTANNTRIEYRGNERFPFCSTFKVMGVSAILKQSMTNKNLLQDRITYTAGDVVTYSPVTEKHIDSGMTVSELCAAAMTYTDNTAINLLMKKIGGLDVVNAFARSIGDSTFRLDRWEPNLNTAIPGDSRDTTTPAAMAGSLQKLALGNALAAPQREQLQTWLKDNTTGNARIRAGVPKGWLVGDKTGSGDYGTTNDVGIIWPPNCQPIVLAVYFTQPQQNATPRNEVIASATRLAIEEFAQTDQCLKKL